MAKITKKAEVLLEYQNYIETSPYTPKQLYSNAASNDEITIDTWKPTWIANYKANSKKFGPFKDKSIAKLFGTNKNKPAIVAGSGPSLKRNILDLKNKGDICLLSCLHNFHIMEDNGIDVDYYVSLDSGNVVLEEISEGGSKTPEEYWALTKDKTLLAFAASPPALLEKWQGTVLFYNCGISDIGYMNILDETDPLHIYVSNGGNVLGACLYIAKAILGSNPIAYVGADFAFSYENKFHGWDSKYDAKLGHVLKCVDVFGNKVLSWQSYQNFKGWFEWVAMQVPGIYINCTEGGTFGSYAHGNIMAVKQMYLSDFLDMYSMSDTMRISCENPAGIRNEKGELERHILF